jgi:hypothetical protein
MTGKNVSHVRIPTEVQMERTHHVTAISIIMRTQIKPANCATRKNRVSAAKPTRVISVCNVTQASTIIPHRLTGFANARQDIMSMMENAYYVKFQDVCNARHKEHVINVIKQNSSNHMPTTTLAIAYQALTNHKKIHHVSTAVYQFWGASNVTTQQIALNVISPSTSSATSAPMDAIVKNLIILKTISHVRSVTALSRIVLNA